MATRTRKPVPRSTLLLLLEDRYSLRLRCENCKTACHGKEHNTKNFGIKHTGPGRFSLIEHSSEIEFKELLGYNNKVYCNGRKLRVVRVKNNNSNGRHLEIEFEVLFKNDKGFYDTMQEKIMTSN